MIVALRRPRTALCLLALVATAAGCSGGSPNFETPDACFAAAKTAVSNKDPLTFCRCLTDESQQTVAGAMVLVGSMTKMMNGMASLGGGESGEQAAKVVADISAVLEKYGVTDEALKKAAPAVGPPQSAEAMRSLAEPVNNKPMFIAEMIGALDKMSQGPSFAQKMGEEYAGDLKDVNIDGDNATAIVSGPSVQKTIEFRKTTEGWRIHIDPDKLNAAGASPPVRAALASQAILTSGVMPAAWPGRAL